MRTVKVTAILSSPLGSDPPMLDALCEFAMAGKMGSVISSSNGHRHACPLVPRGQQVSREAVGKVPIPIARSLVDGLPIPHASSPICSSIEADRATHYTSQYPIAQTGLLRPKELTKIVTGGGRYKSFRLPLRTRLIERVVWFAALREKPSRLRGLLSSVHGLGKKQGYGYGAVAEWLVEPLDDDWSWIAPSEAGPVLMRPLPISAAPKGLLGCRRDFGGVVGPYWQREFWRERVTPC